jgi:DNA invertase Pin-like site-specific DNA recombinase
MKQELVFGQILYEAIEAPANKIETVYCWELSRLSRRPQTLYNVKEYLFNKQIDLRTKHENLRMLDNSNFSLIFSIYAGMCESEINNLSSG